MNRSLAIAAVLVIVTGPVLAQGNNTCATAQPITGVGNFLFNLSAATTDGSPDPLCLNGASDQIESDVWWSWTAPSTAPYSIETCNMTASPGIDTRVAVYDGVCGGAILACDDNGCATPAGESSLMFNATGGNVYLIRAGKTIGTTSGLGFIVIEDLSPPTILETAINPVNGRTYHLLEPSSWTEAEAVAISLGGHLATIRDQGEQDFVVNTFFNWNGTEGRDIWIGLNDAAVDLTYVWASGETSAYTFFAAGEPNSSAGGAEDYIHLWRIFQNGEWNDVENEGNGGVPNAFGLVELIGGESFCNGDGGDQMGCSDCPCGNNAMPGTVGGCLNSALTSAQLVQSGAPSVMNDTLRFEMSGATPVSFAVLTSGAAQAPANVASPCFGQNSGVLSVNLDGLRCAVQSVQRHGSRPVDANGDVGVTANGWGPPSGPAGGLIAQGGFTAGQTRYYQSIYREVPGTGCATEQNTSQGVGLTFAP